MASYILVIGFIVWIIALFSTWILSFRKYEMRYDKAYAVVIVSIFPIAAFFALIAYSSDIWNQFKVIVGSMIALSVISLSTDPLISLKKRVTRWMCSHVAKKTTERNRR